MTSFLTYGQMVYDRTIDLSRKVNTELMEPIAQWLDDPEFMDRFTVTESEKPDWAEYKRRQREYDLRAAWEAMRIKRERKAALTRYQRYVAGLIPRSSRGSPTGSPNTQSSTDFLIPILTPMSPHETNIRETEQEFSQALGMYVSDLLPWELIISQHLTRFARNTGKCTFTQIPVIYEENPRKDKVAKFIHLLHMESDGIVSLSQNEHDGEIGIEPVDIRRARSIAIKTRSGLTEHFDWDNLSDNQRNKIIADAKEHRILCKIS